MLKKLTLALVLVLAGCSGSSSKSGAVIPKVDPYDDSDPGDPNVSQEDGNIGNPKCDTSGVNTDGYLNGIVNGAKLGKNNPISRRVVLIYNDAGGGYAEICTGSLLPGNVILTAGHCVTSPDKMTIRFTNNIFCSTKSLTRNVDKVVKHPGYDGTTKSTDDDLAMIHFTGTLVPGFTTFGYPKADFHLENSDTLIMAGYGVTGYTLKDSGILRITKASAYDMTYSSKGSIILDQTKTGVCSGDSGSGLLVYRNNHLEIVGVTSTVAQASNIPQERMCSGMASFVDLSKHQDWLKAAFDSLRR